MPVKKTSIEQQLAREQSTTEWRKSVRIAWGNFRAYQGYREGLQKAALLVLEDRFGALPSWVEKRVCEEMFPEHSERLIREALAAPNLGWLFGQGPDGEALNGETSQLR